MTAQTTALSPTAPRQIDVAMLVPQTVAGFYDFAADVFAAGMMPSSYKSAPQIAIAMIKGHEFGMLPMQSVDAFYVVGNRAVPWGKALRGLVQSSGNLEGELDGYIEGIEEFAFMASEPNPHKEGSVDHELFAELQRALARRGARVKAKGAGQAYLCGYSVVKKRGAAAKCYLFDSYEAQKYGLLTKSGPWTMAPGRMCMHRAATQLRSDTFSDRLTGLDATVEELMDGGSMIDLGTQAPPAPPPTGAPASVLRDLSRPRVVEVVQPPPVVPGEEPQAHPPDEPAVEPAPPPVDVSSITPTARGLTALNGTDALKGVIGRIKAAGGKANDWHEAASMRALGVLKPATKMTSEERHRVAMELAQLWDEDQARIAEQAAPMADGSPAPAEPATPAEQPAAPEAETTGAAVPPELDF